MKLRTSVFIEREILEKAKKLGLNVSQCCENTLRLYIEAIEGFNRKICMKNPEAAKKDRRKHSGR
ncbi:MAG: type II toxin-antitoxin system CcdA family antitoxin [Candidatus Bathyarchaeia archaeon]|nr:type II toxin-antitoxin system CcdA family antitoxin [Thermoproteota archaeon]